MSESLPSSKRTRVAIIGGGLAGIASARALADYDFDVTLYEARQHLGGRAGSYVDQTTGEVIDNCQHVNMGCCTNLQLLCRQLGIEQHFKPQNCLFFVAPDGKISEFCESKWLPAPLHLSAAFLRLPYLSLKEKRLFAAGVRALAKSTDRQLRGHAFDAWLREHGQTDVLIRRVWEVVLVSALSETLDRVDAAYARKVFVDGFLANREGWRVEIPDASLDDVYSRQTLIALRGVGARVCFGDRIKRMRTNGNQITNVATTNGESIVADEYILAIPQHQVRRLFPEELQGEQSLQKLDTIETAPISSVHLWFDRPVTELPHAVLVDRFSQWMFARGASQDPEGRSRYAYQVVISASRNISGMSMEDIVSQVINDLAEIWPVAGVATLLHSRVITEKRAVFSVSPGIDELRPTQQSFLENLQFAGDWTQTGWPATMEGAVRSGYLAAQNILHKYGNHAQVLADDLPRTTLAATLLRLPSS